MKKSALGLMATLSLMLPACSSMQSGAAPDGKVTYYPVQPVSKSEYQEQSLYELGRVISHNSVDLYDPALLTFLLPTDDPKYQSPLSKFPAHQEMVIKDEAVVVYAMARPVAPEPVTQEVEYVGDGSVLIAKDIGEPIPLVNDEAPLPP